MHKETGAVLASPSSGGIESSEAEAMTGILERAQQLVCGLRGHHVIVHFERDRLSLRCFNCALHTAGWNLKPEASHEAKVVEPIFRAPSFAHRFRGPHHATT
jgi:hypothetical protein